MKTRFIVAVIFLLHGYFGSFAQKIGREIEINLPQLQQSLQSNSAVNAVLNITLPSPAGGNQIFEVKSSPVLEKQPASIQTFEGQSNDKSVKIRFTITPTGGFSAIMHYQNGYYLIEAIDKNAGKYRIYNMNEARNGECHNNDQARAFGMINPPNNGRVLSISPFPIGSQLRTYRMAAAATGEMTITFGSQLAASNKIVEIINANNLIYELEASVRFSLISATVASPYPLIFTTPSTDPFTVDANFAVAGYSQTGFNTLNGNMTLLYNQYDVGHTFNSYTTSNAATWPTAMAPSYFLQGQAGGTPCDDASKAIGWTEFRNDADLGSIVKVFAHEVAHQFKSWHTYNAVGGFNNFCASGWDANTAIEPGAGTTLMGYNSNCGIYTLTNPNFEGYFHTKSLEQIYNTVANISTCFSTSVTGNTPPVANAGANYTIPKGTPFTLTGTATDANNDNMSYAWEQYDIATANDKGAFGANTTGSGGYTAVNSTANAPLFRSRILTTPSRTFPSLNFILNNANNPADSEGEALPQVARTMNFRFTVRDNRTGGGGVDSDDAVVTVGSAGPFRITSQNSSILWISNNGANTATITWDVNSTNLAPINASNVKISFSTDGGTTFPTVLIASTPNDGSHVINIPNLPTSTGRIKIEATDNIFFDINNANIIISNTCTPETSNIAPAATVSAQVGNAALNLGLAPVGSAFNSVSGSLTTSDVSSSVAGNNGGCVNFGGNPTRIDAYPFQVTTAGSHTFTLTAPFGTLINLYSGTFNPAAPCTNWLASSYDASSGNVGTVITQTLAAGAYTLVVSSFNASLPGYPANYSVAINTSVFNSVNTTGNYAYTYLIHNTTTGNIQGFAANSDLTAYPVGSYTVYGISYAAGLDLSGYVNSSFSSFQTLITNGTVCGKFSTNTKSVTITPNCATTLALSGTATAGTQQAIQSITSTQIIDNGTTVTYRAGNSITLSPLANSGFVANSGSVFKVEIGGCQ
jgi:Metallo-peptidase family M12B Reprolysin-like